MSTAFDWTNSQMAARFAFPFLCLVFLCFSVLLILFVLSLELFSLSRFFIRWLLSDRSLRSAILSRSPLHPSLGSSLFAARPGSSLFAVARPGTSLFAVACPSPHVAGCWSFDSLPVLKEVASFLLASSQGPTRSAPRPSSLFCFPSRPSQWN